MMRWKVDTLGVSSFLCDSSKDHGNCEIWGQFHKEILDWPVVFMPFSVFILILD